MNSVLNTLIILSACILMLATPTAVIILVSIRSSQIKNIKIAEGVDTFLGTQPKTKK